MTPYQPQDLNDGWEFKILRSLTGAFGKPEKLREFLDEEAKAGWVLVEKFDNNRIRLKRPAMPARQTPRSNSTPTAHTSAFRQVKLPCGRLSLFWASHY